jgi:uncharacterized integral membrane protein
MSNAVKSIDCSKRKKKFFQIISHTSKFMVILMFLSFVVINPMVVDVALFFDVLVMCSKDKIV